MQLRRLIAGFAVMGLGTGALLAHGGGGAAADPTPGAWGWGAWPYNGWGQVGRGTTDGSNVPVGVVGLPVGSDVRDVAAGGQHSLAALGDGSAVAWGNARFGALGNGSVANVGNGTPSVVSGLGPGSGVVAVAAGGSHSLALTGSGVVIAWGYNSHGQVGDGSTVDRSTPVVVPGLSGVVGIAAGMEWSVAVKGDGSVWAWGEDASGEVTGSGGPDVLAPTPVPGLGAGSGVVQVQAGLWHGLARTADGHVYSWGRDTEGASLGLDITAPHLIAGFDAVGAVDVDAGGSYSVAAMADGSMTGWGGGSYGRRCDGGGPWNAAAGATDLGAGGGVVDVEAGWQSTLVRLADGSVFGCGYDGNNELGTGFGGVGAGGAVIALHPTPVIGFGPGSGVTDIATGFAHSLAAATNPTPAEPPPTSSSAPTTSTTMPAPPVDTASIGDATVEEGDSGSRTANVTVTLDHPLSTKTVLTVTARSTDASLNDFKVFTNKPVTIPAYASSAKVPITYFGDGATDGTKHVTLTLSGTSAVAVSDGVGTLTLADDDAPTAALPEITVGDGRAYEGDGVKTNLAFTVALSKASTVPITVRLSTINWSASGGADFIAKTNLLVSFPAGSRFKLITIPIYDERAIEIDEAFLVSLANPTGATIGDSIGVGTIANDD